MWRGLHIFASRFECVNGATIFNNTYWLDGQNSKNFYWPGASKKGQVSDLQTVERCLSTGQASDEQIGDVLQTGEWFLSSGLDEWWTGERCLTCYCYFFYRLINTHLNSNGTICWYCEKCVLPRRIVKTKTPFAESRLFVDVWCWTRSSRSHPYV